jgi:hypothetical protein
MIRGSDAPLSGIVANDFDPVWGSLGAPREQGNGVWPGESDEQIDGVFVDVELLGDGFHLSGQVHLGQFDRLSGWLNMQSGFIQVRHARQVRAGQANDADTDAEQAGTLWVRLNQIVVVADRSAIGQVRSGAPIVQKQRRKVSIVTRGYALSGNVHVHAHGEIAQFLEATDPRFLPITELTVRWLAGPVLVARFPFAMVNREQLVTFLEERDAPAAGVEPQEVRSA